MGQFNYDFNRAEGIGAQLLGEMMAAAVGIPQTGWTYTQNLLTGAIAVHWTGDQDMTAQQRSAINSAVTNHTPVVKEFRAADFDPPTPRAIETEAWAWRNWATISASAKDLILKTLLLVQFTKYDKPT